MKQDTFQSFGDVLKECTKEEMGLFNKGDKCFIVQMGLSPRISSSDKVDQDDTKTPNVVCKRVIIRHTLSLLGLWTNGEPLTFYRQVIHYRKRIFLFLSYQVRDKMQNHS